MEKCPREECEKAWGKDICLATKGSKIKLGIMWGIMVFCAISALGSVGTLVSIVSAQSSREATQQGDIKRNTEKIEHVERAHENLEGNVNAIRRDVNKMQVEQAVQGEIIRGLAEKFRVPIPENPNGH